MIYQPPLKEVASAVYYYVYTLSAKLFWAGIEKQNGICPRKTHRNERWTPLFISLRFHLCRPAMACARIDASCADSRHQMAASERRSAVLCCPWSKSSTRLLVVVCRTDVLRSVFGSSSGCQKTSDGCETGHNNLEGTMASGVHAVALRLKQAKKKKLLLDQQQQQLGLKPPLDKVTSVRIVEPTRSVGLYCQNRNLI